MVAAVAEVDAILVLDVVSLAVDGAGHAGLEEDMVDVRVGAGLK